MVDLEFVERFEDVVPMDVLRDTAGLEEFPLLMKGQRLSIMRITRKQFEIVRRLGRARTTPAG